MPLRQPGCQDRGLVAGGVSNAAGDLCPESGAWVAHACRQSSERAEEQRRREAVRAQLAEITDAYKAAQAQARDAQKQLKCVPAGVHALTIPPCQLGCHLFSLSLHPCSGEGALRCGCYSAPWVLGDAGRVHQPLAGV